MIMEGLDDMDAMNANGCPMLPSLSDIVREEGNLLSTLRLEMYSLTK